MLRVLVLVLLFSFIGAFAQNKELIKCEVVIAGGSTAALAAALSSASEGAHTCLLEPTDWVGGQMTASAVPAIDFAWHTLVDRKTGFKLDVAEIDYQAVNQAPNFWNALFHSFNESGYCATSKYRTCYLPMLMLHYGFYPLISAVGDHLTIYYHTVVKKVNVSNRVITSLTAIQRSPTPTLECNGYDIFPSRDLPDWYSYNDSSRWTKTVLEFVGPVFMDLTDWGELLPLAGASYLQGIDERWDGDVSGIGNDTCGQAFTYSFAEIYNFQPTPEPPNPYKVDYPQHYGPGSFANGWSGTWIYRRMKSELNKQFVIAQGDITLQNCGGNDFDYGYIFLSKNDSAQTLDDWQGGVNIDVMWSGEREAMGWHYYYKAANKSVEDYITLDTSTLGTCHGLAKMPYLRDSRRSIGIDDFLITIGNITGIAEDMVGYAYYDRLAIGSYDVDIHKIQVCNFPDYMNDLPQYGVLPFFMPFRAMTNRDIDNLLVAGKTMAMSFLANAAVRVHPCEWASGTAAGVAAAYMVNHGLSTTTQALADIANIQARSKLYTPSSWTINGTLYPPQ